MISACMIVLDEEACIARALDSIHNYVDEIVIVDGGSKDKTKEIVSTYSKVVLIENPWPDDYSIQRNIAIEHAKGDWIFSLDADQYISTYIGESLYKLSLNDNYDAYTFTYKFFIDDIFINLLGITRRIKLFRNYGRWEGRWHEELIGCRNITDSNLDVYHSKTRLMMIKDNQHYWNMGQQPDKGWHKEGDKWIADINDISYMEAFSLVNNLSQDGIFHQIVQHGPEFVIVCEKIQQFFENKVCNSIVEIGSYTGGSLTVLSKTINQPTGLLVAIEPQSEIPFLAQLVLETCVPHKVIHIPHFSYEPVAILTLESIVKEYGKISVLHIDGNSSYFSYLSDFLVYERFVKTPGMIIFHDVLTTTGVEQAYASIKKDYGYLFSRAEEVSVKGGTGEGILYRD